MKTFLSLLLILSSFSLQAHVIGGLKQEAAFRFMGYIHNPLTRDKFRLFGLYDRYKKKQIESIRSRLNPKIAPLREYLKNQFENPTSGLMEYDPSMHFQLLDVDSWSGLDEMVFPATIRFLLSTSKGYNATETVALSFKQKPTRVYLGELYGSLVNIFNTEYEYKPPKERYKSEQERELLEPLKVKNYSFYQYEPYFAFYFGGEFLVDKQYAADLGRVLNAKYISIFRSFKTRYFLTSSEVKGLVNAGVIKDIQTIIEESPYAGKLEAPFQVDRNLLPASILRLDKKINELRLSLIIGGRAESFNPKNRKIINKYFEKSIKNH